MVAVGDVGLQRLNVGGDEHLRRRPVAERRSATAAEAQASSGTASASAAAERRNRVIDALQRTGKQVGHSKHSVRSSRFRAGGIASGAKSAGGQVGRGVVRLEVAPALECLDRPAFDLHQRRVEQDAGAAGAVVPVVGHDVQDPLPHQHGAGDHPVEAPLAADLGDPARQVAGLMPERRPHRQAHRLDLPQVGDVADADRQLGQVNHACS